MDLEFKVNASIIQICSYCSYVDRCPHNRDPTGTWDNIASTAAAHSASDYICLLSTLASGPQVGAQTLDTGAIRQDNEQLGATVT